ncbi:hypothetical protein DPM13_15465 [Paracoccus mutanolyticus]|uniref:LysR substrate-binding domain-containing protein n=1 Tax=Paracoccus mutanolyticus TaxID=1499308 RepID=A0ABN5M7E8_9RHOB|nr:hypothetical protein DPM13_15465 [Paracoccus mutanolyticus]
MGQSTNRIHCWLRVRSSHAVIQHLSSQQFDVGFSALEFDLPQVRREPLGTMPMLAVLPLGHFMCDKSVLEPKDFHQQPFIALGSEISTRSDTDRHCRDETEDAVSRRARDADSFAMLPGPMSRLRPAICAKSSCATTDLASWHRLSTKRASVGPSPMIFTATG